MNNSKSGRRRSPVPSRKHGERIEKGGGTTPGGAASSSTHSGLQGTSSNNYLIPAASSNLNLPVTPSTQSLLSVTDERSHNTLQSTFSAPPGVVDSMASTSKPSEDQSVDDDAVKNFNIYFKTN